MSSTNSMQRRGIRIEWLAVVALAVGGPVAAAPEPDGTSLGGCKIAVDRELWIRDLSVVNDTVRTTWVAEPTQPSQGVWSFGRLMSNISGKKDPSDFVLNLFDHFRTTQHVNGFDIPPHLFMLQEIIDPWIAASQAKGHTGLDFSIAPFRLNGFVNRIDLRTNATYGTANSAGEGRIVFSVLRPGGSTSLFTFILEYELLAADCDEVKAWAEDWHALGAMKFGKKYNSALEKLVNRFAGPNAAPGHPNGSALSQARTNEFFGDDFWQWREFQLSATTGMLVQTTVAQTVQTETVNRTKLLADFVNDNEAAILAGEHVVPLTYQGQPFRGGSSNGEGIQAFFEADGILNNDARHLFSLNNCVACHTLETGTNFFHSFPRNADSETFLSGFLLGTTIQDPVDPKVTRTFNDLKRRAEDLCGVLCSPCSVISTQKPLLRVH